MARRESVRVGLLRGLGVMLIVGFALGTAVSAWVAIVLHGLTRDIQTSEANLPSQVRDVLPRSSNVLDHPQVTMVRYSSGISKGAVVLFATVPDRRLAGFMTMPPSTRLDLKSFGHLSPKAAIQALRRHGIPVTHVALISPS